MSSGKLNYYYAARREVVYESGLLIEHFADLVTERFGRERLVQERDPGGEDTVVDNSFLGVPRHTGSQ
jgi:hypothetical protein